MTERAAVPGGPASRSTARDLDGANTDSRTSCCTCSRRRQLPVRDGLTLLDAIAAGQAGGVIFFGGNITSLNQIARVVRRLDEAQGQSPVQLRSLLP